MQKIHKHLVQSKWFIFKINCFLYCNRFEDVLLTGSVILNGKRVTVLFGLQSTKNNLKPYPKMLSIAPDKFQYIPLIVYHYRWLLRTSHLNNKKNFIELISQPSVDYGVHISSISLILPISFWVLHGAFEILKNNVPPFIAFQVQLCAKILTKQ